MIKKIFLTLACVLLTVSASMAATQLKVIATEDFKTESPSKTINVIIPEESTLGSYTLSTNTVLHCDVLKVVDPKRGKRSAGFFVQPTSFTYKNETTEIKENMYGKYSKFVLSKEELKKIPPFKLVKKAALTVGNYFVKGASVAYYFVEGAVKNENDNRLKSGAKSAFDSTPLSYIEEGAELDIKVGDEFYFVFKTEEDIEEPNYTYTEQKS